MDGGAAMRSAPLHLTVVADEQSGVHGLPASAAVCDARTVHGECRRIPCVDDFSLNLSQTVSARSHSFAPLSDFSVETFLLKEREAGN
jgi:hypothetical protein